MTVHKEYLNRNFETNASNIKPAGTESVGTLDTTVRADHVHPTQILYGTSNPTSALGRDGDIYVKYAT